ncbi:MULTISPECIES: NtaA/DmoA family FMN-dependent monooxygenase [unclassified Pseudoclavibacter]|uniref:NtaA/DmoA family FMN-dependent monooxygenase n=1 Tax=unclassified Pseudoclavibacter TaxID=2615177 RepID=UPI001300FCA8|nr:MULTISPECIES: NtaA/DmoA family FMN-dependent monooxygenase [unclassified Pseudoclavibacter]KAB1644486.1 NtaA/DmoA family FMN-dependent monooxygenase [Pseudoclavibacter sp. CFCC 14310]KAB1664010.1 NtaA/DmoA family FMN-dependent monooxygenase [Pseudoclavibacter sp. CFCC 13611]
MSDVQRTLSEDDVPNKYGHARSLILNVNLQGYGQRPAAWRVQDVVPDDQITPGFWNHLAAVAERGRLDAAFFADHPAGENPNPRPLGLNEPFALAASIAASTEHLGIVATASTTYNDPLELAARVLGTDIVAGGRIGWNVVTTYSPKVSANFGVAQNPDRETRYRRAREFTEAVIRLWKTSGTDQSVDFHGELVDVVGRLDLPHSPQRHPVLFQAGGSAQGRDLAARFADGVFAVELTKQGAIDHRAYVRDRAAAYGRNPDSVNIVPGLSLVIGSTQAEAERLYDELESLVPDSYTIGSLNAILEADVSSLPLDEPIPDDVLHRPVDESAHVASAGYRETFLDWIRDNNDSLRGVLRKFGGYGARIIVGTPEQIADDIEDWYRAGAADGFNLMIDRFPAGLEKFVDEVVPLLQRKGIFKREYHAQTLRERLGAHTLLD